MIHLIKFEGEIIRRVLANHSMTEEEICESAGIRLAITQEDFEGMPENGKYDLNELEFSSCNLKWAIIDRCEHDEFLNVFAERELALSAADREWFFMTEHDKKQRVSFVVGLVNVELDDNGQYQYFEYEDGSIDSDIYEIAETYK